MGFAARFGGGASCAPEWLAPGFSVRMRDVGCAHIDPSHLERVGGGCLCAVTAADLPAGPTLWESPWEQALRGLAGFCERESLRVAGHAFMPVAFLRNGRAHGLLCMPVERRDRTSLGERVRRAARELRG